MTNETTASQPMQELVRDLYNFEGGRHFALRLEKMLASQPESIGDDAQFFSWLDRLGDCGNREQFKQVSADFIAYIHEFFRAPAAQASATIQAAPETAKLINDPLTERKSADIISRGYKKVGYVLQNEAGEYCLSAQSAVRWLKQPEYWRLMHEQDGSLFAATIQEPVMVAEPVGAVLDENSGIATLLQSYKEGRNTAEHTLLMIETLLSAAPMVADPAGVAFPPLPPCDVHAGDEAFGDNVSGYSGYAMQEYARTTLALAATVKAVPSEALTGAARDVLDERQRQVEREGWTPEHDDTHNDGSMAQAAACYAYPELVTVLPGLNAWPWAEAWFKVRDPRRNYVRAAALLLAEIERIDRAAPLADKTGGGDHG